MDSKMAKNQSIQVRYDEINVNTKPLKQKNWTPLAIRTPFLVFFATTLVLCAIALEVLLHNVMPLGQAMAQPDVFKRQVTPTQVMTSKVTNPSDYLSLTTSTSTSTKSTPGTVAATKTNADEYLKLPQSPTPSTKPTLSSSPVPITATAPSANSAIVPGNQNIASQSSQAGQGVAKDHSQSVAKPVVTLITSVYTSGSQQITSIVTSTNTPNSTMPTDTVKQAVSELRRPDLQVKGNFTKVWYFAAIYLPSIVAVIVRELWSIIACGLKLMEPFFLLSNPDGATGQETLLADYLSSTTSWYTMSSAARGNKLMIIIQCANILTSFLAPIATESMTVAVLSKVTDSNGVTHRSGAAWALNRVFVRLLQGMFSCLAILVVLVAILGWKRHSGLSANPSKIATMASLLNQPSVFQDVHAAQSPALGKRSKKSIAHNRYKIVHYQDQSGNNCCGLIKVGTAESMEPQRTISRYGGHEDGTDSMPTDDHGSWQMHGNITRRISDGVLLIFVIGLLGILVANYMSSSDRGFNAFFNSGEFGPKFILSLGASFATMSFQNIEREVRLAIPHKRLAARQATPDHSVLRSVNGTAASSILQSIKHATWFHFLIACTTILGDALIIVIVGVPFSDNVTLTSFTISNWLSMCLLILMLVATIAVFVWRRKNKRLNLPCRSNDTLIQVWASVSNSENQLRALLSDAGNMTDNQLRERLKRDGGRYWAGWIKNRDNRDVWCVDREDDHSGRFESRHWEARENERQSFLTR